MDRDIPLMEVHQRRSMRIGSNFITKTGDYTIPFWLYKSTAKKSLLDKTTEALNNDPNTRREFISWRRTLVYTAVVLAVLHLGLVGTFLGFSIYKDSTSLAGNIYVNTPVYSASTVSFTSTLTLLTPVTYHLWWLVIGCPCICALFLFIYIYTGWIVFSSEEDEKTALLEEVDDATGFYYEILLIGGNKTTWFLNALAGSGIIWIVAAICGVTDLVTLILLAGINIAAQITGGLFHEWWNNGLTQAFRFDQDQFHDIRDPPIPEVPPTPPPPKELSNAALAAMAMKIGVTYPKAPGVSVRQTSEQEFIETREQERVRWWPFGVGILLFALMWGVVFTYFGLAVGNIGVSSVPWYTWAILFGIFGLVLLFALVIIIHYVNVQSEGDEFLKQFRGSGTKGLEMVKETRVAAVRRNGMYEWFKLLLAHLINMVLVIFFFIAIYVR